MSTKFTPTPQEIALVNQIFAQADPQKLGVITGDAAVKVFSGSKLPPAVLAEVWNIADEDNNGVLTRKGVAVAVRLLGHAQRGERLSESLVNKPGPVPTIEGLSPVAAPSTIGVPPAKSPPPSGLPPLTPQDKAKFLKLFLGCHPINGLLSGEKARDVFVKSKLPVDKLSQIWNLADTKNRGALDATDFTIAMYLIQACMSGQLQTIPATLPPYVYEQAANGIVPQATGDSAHASPSLTGAFPNRPVQPQFTGQTLSSIQSQMTGQAFPSIQPQTTGQMRSTPTAPPLPARSGPPSSSGPTFPFLQQQSTGATPQWDVTPQEKVNSDRIFDSLDTQKKGYIEGDVAVPFMLQSKLPEDVLAQVWDLADLNNDGRLTRDGFAVAMHLIQGKLAGKDIPSSLPLSLVPPAMRGSGSALAGPSQPPVPEAIKDLLWDDSPPASATASTHPQSVLQPQATGTRSPHPLPTVSPPPRATPAPVSDPFAGGTFSFNAAPPPQPQPHKDLLGDDDEHHASSPPLQDQSAEIGNVKNQLSSTNKSLETAKAERSNLERQLTEQAALLASLQTQLSSAKAAYDTETRLLGTLKERFASQSAEIQKTREDLIHAESDLSATRVEKAEIEGALLRDKEEVRDLHRKMSEVGAQIEATKAEVEKLRKEAKQQKGLLAIAKKQLATREAEKAKADKELEEARAELQEATKGREDAEAQLAKQEGQPPQSAQLTNGHASPPPAAPSPDPSLMFAASQPLPTSPDVSPPASKSTNPFERLTMSSSPRPESPFLPFTASSVLPTPPTAPAKQEEESAEDPFGLKSFITEEPQALASEPETPKPSTAPVPLAIGSPIQQEVLSPAETDFFTTPPSTATAQEHTSEPQREDSAVSRFPPLEDNVTGESPPTPTGPQTATPQNQQPEAGREDTDLAHELKEIEQEDSDSESSSDNEPLTSVKAKLKQSPEKQADGVAAGTSAFDDSFGISSTEKPLQFSPPKDAAPVSGPTESTDAQASGLANSFASMFETPAVSRDAPPSAPIPAFAETTKPNGSAAAAASTSAGVSDFDQALGKLPSMDSSATSSEFTNITFDSAFDDNFDFAAASAAQPTTNGTAESTSSAPAFPPPPSAAAAAPARQGSSFDDVFGTQTSAPSAAQPPALTIPTFPSSTQPSTQASKQLSFDDAFGAGAGNAPPNFAASTSSQSNGGFSFEDAFGGNDDALALDSSFTSQTPSYQPPPGMPPSKTGPTPFPTSSTPSSPRGSGSTQPSGRRSASPMARVASPTPRQSSPVPRHSSPRPRSSTADSSKEKAAATRHNRLSIRLPFGRKKKHHDAPPVPALSQQQIVEDPTPAVDDDVEAVKTLCGMGFSRTQAVTALEEHGYDVQRALNSLLGTS